MKRCTIRNGCVWVCVYVCMCVYSVERIECEGDDDRCCVRVENW